MKRSSPPTSMRAIVGPNVFASAALMSLIALSFCGGAANAASKGVSALPSLPPEIIAKKQFIVGTKCDYPPFGFKDASNTIKGFEPAIAHAFARMAFGDANAVDLQCVTSGNRVAFLQSGRVDLLIATVSYSPEREAVVDFSKPYYASGGVLLVPRDSPISGPYNVGASTVVTFSGSTYDQWFKKCTPQLNLLYVDGVSDGLSALDAGRAVAFAQDDTVLSYIASTNTKFKLTGPLFAVTPWGINVRKGETRLLTWLNAAIDQLIVSGEFVKMFEQTIPDKTKLGVDLAEFLPGISGAHQLHYATNRADIYNCTLRKGVPN